MLLGQYECELAKGHPKANHDGYVYVHILVAEKKLGRYLTSKEVVHHIDENKLNNNPDNLLVFTSKAEHTAYHYYKDMNLMIYNDDGTVSYKYGFSQICPICGEWKDHHAEICLECRRKKNAEHIPSRIELKTMIRVLPFTQIAKKYNVTDNAVRKWCKRYNLPFRTKDIKRYTEQEWIDV